MQNKHNKDFGPRDYLREGFKLLSSENQDEEDSEEDDESSDSEESSESVNKKKNHFSSSSEGESSSSDEEKKDLDSISSDVGGDVEDSESSDEEEVEYQQYDHTPEEVKEMPHWNEEKVEACKEATISNHSKISAITKQAFSK